VDAMKTLDHTIEIQGGEQLSRRELLLRLHKKTLPGSLLCRGTATDEWRRLGEVFEIVGNRYGAFGSLGSGAFGTVTLAIDLKRALSGRSDRFVALKRPTTGFFEHYRTRLGRGVSTEEARDRARRAIGQAFSEEVALTTRLAMCPHVVAVRSHDISVPYIALEFCNGGSLADRMERSYTLTEAIDWACQIARGLDAAHGLEPDQLIHRDLKPDNVLISGQTLKISDFGTSKLSELNESLELSQGGGYTPYYAAPEAFDRKASAKTDVWSLGVILYELLSQKRPFSGSTLQELMTHISVRDPAPMAPDLPLAPPPELVELVMRCLAKEAEKRPTAAAVIGELNRFILPMKANTIQVSSGQSEASAAKTETALENMRTETEGASLMTTGRALTSEMREGQEQIEAPSGHVADKPSFVNKILVAVFGLGLPLLLIALWQFGVPEENGRRGGEGAMQKSSRASKSSADAVDTRSPTVHSNASQEPGPGGAGIEVTGKGQPSASPSSALANRKFGRDMRQEGKVVIGFERIDTSKFLKERRRALMVIVRRLKTALKSQGLGEQAIEVIVEAREECDPPPGLDFPGSYLAWRFKLP
jgi:serine/threonine protein kinase